MLIERAMHLIQSNLGHVYFWTELITEWQIIQEFPMLCILRISLSSKNTTASYIWTKFASIFFPTGGSVILSCRILKDESKSAKTYCLWV